MDIKQKACDSYLSSYSTTSDRCIYNNYDNRVSSFNALKTAPLLALAKIFNVR